MGKSWSSSSTTSSSSCLKMIACGSNSNSNSGASDDDDIHHHTLTTPSQTKGPGDKRGWSFRKKSGRHRVLGNNVTSEATNFADKEIPQVNSVDFQGPLKSTTSDEKPQLLDPVYKVGEDSPLAYVVESKTSLEVFASENDCSLASEKPKTSQLLVASDNGRNSTSTEADQGLVVLENGSFDPSADLGIVTDLVFSEAESDQMTELKTSISEDGSDTCVMVDELVAIIVQTSIRGFLARQGFFQLKNVVTLQAVIRGHLVRRNAVETLHCIRGIAKVQALVRAQSSKSLDQNYKKGEGQFSTAKLLKNSFARQLLESTPKPKSVSIRCDPLSPNSAWGWLERWMSVTTEVLQTAEPSTDLQDGNQAQPYHSLSDVELPSISQSDSSVSKITMDEMTKSSEGEGNHGNHVVELVDSQSSLPIFVEKQQSHHQMAEEINEDVNCMKMDAHVSVISVSHEIQQPKLSAKRSASEELNGEGKKISCGVSTASNPAVDITGSKFEPSIVGVDGSECGTELSITSTLDSPDRSELEIEQPETEVKTLETSLSVDGSKEGQDCIINDMSTNNFCDLPSETIQQEEVSIIPVVAEVNSQVDQKSAMKASGEPMIVASVNSVVDGNFAVMDLKEDKNEQNASLDHVTGVQASPKSHLTVPESQGTPSSQVSVNKNRNRIGKSGSNTKPSSRSAGKRSPSNPNLDSGARTSVEHLAKDHKSGKRRNSFGSAKSDNDQEPRESSSHNSLPSYMQATQSAKAKAHSPRSSPDFHDKEVTSKKRQSLSGASGRQRSPRVQRSSSEIAQGAKAGSHPSIERKWQR